MSTNSVELKSVVIGLVDCKCLVCGCCWDVVVIGEEQAQLECSRGCKGGVVVAPGQIGLVPKEGFVLDIRWK